MASKKLYEYTIYRQDGTIEKLPPQPKMEWDGKGGVYEILNCRTIQLVPTDYLKDGMYKRANWYMDEEARFRNDVRRNPHFKVLTGDILDPFAEWDIVGDVVSEQVYKGAPVAA